MPLRRLDFIMLRHGRMKSCKGHFSGSSSQSPHLGSEEGGRQQWLEKLDGYVGAQRSSSQCYLQQHAPATPGENIQSTVSRCLQQNVPRRMCRAGEAVSTAQQHISHVCRIKGKDMVSKTLIPSFDKHNHVSTQFLDVQQNVLPQKKSILQLPLLSMPFKTEHWIFLMYIIWFICTF